MNFCKYILKMNVCRELLDPLIKTQMKKLFIFLILSLLLVKINAQKIDSLARCGNSPYFLIVDYPTNENGNLNYTFEKGGSKLTYKVKGNANLNNRYGRFELAPRITLDNDSEKFYIITLDTTTLYVDNIYLQDFIQDYLTAKKSKMHQEISLDRYFSSVSYRKYAINRKNNVPRYNNGYCFNKLKVIDIKSVETSLALKNILLEIKNEGIITNVNNNQITVEAKNNADFTSDVDYYVVGKPSFRIRFKTNNGSNAFEGTIKNTSEDDKLEIKTGDIITNRQ